jgi:hypothetical protein
MSKIVGCKLCTEYSRKHGCTAKHCPYLAERVKAGALNYKSAVTEAFRSIPMFANNVTALQKRLSSCVWNGAEHQRRLKALRLHVGQSQCPNEYLAAMYLLTATKLLYKHTRPCFTKYGLEFAFLERSGLSVDEYTLLGTAKTLYFGTSDLTAEDISEPEVISTAVLPFIVNAVLIVRFGEAALHYNNM